MSTQVAADLRAAAEVLKRDGWTQGSYHDDNGCHCAMGAVVVVVAGGPIDLDIDLDDELRPRYERALDELQAWIDSHVSLWAIPEWNDSPRRTAEQVIAALLAAADAAEATQGSDPAKGQP